MACEPRYKATAPPCSASCKAKQGAVCRSGCGVLSSLVPRSEANLLSSKIWGSNWVIVNYFLTSSFPVIMKELSTVQTIAVCLAA